MRYLLPVILLLLFAACTENVEVTVNAPSSWQAYDTETITVTCHPTRNVDYVELLIDSAAVGIDSSTIYQFGWDVTGLTEGGVHTVQARATAGSHEYLSDEYLATVGFRSRLVMDGTGKTIWAYLPNGEFSTSFEPSDSGFPVYPRFRPKCASVVYIAQHKLYECAGSGGAQMLDQIGNGIYSCDASPVSALVAYEGYPAATAHLFTKDGSNLRVQLTHDSDFVLIDSSRFTCVANSSPVFSPDGNRLAYYRESKCLVPGDPHEGETRKDAFVMGSDGRNPVNLTSAVDDGYFSGFTWTFDGKWVLFREGAGTTPNRALAANLNGHAVVVSDIEPVAMACSPHDSTLIYIGAESGHHLWAVSLVWTGDTIYVDGPSLGLGNGSFDRYLDWVEYSRQ